MRSPELHADYLLDKDANDELTPEEQARLDEHLAACPACRFEQRVRGDFRAEFKLLEAASADLREPLAVAPRGWIWRPVVWVLLAGLIAAFAAWVFGCTGFWGLNT